MKILRLVWGDQLCRTISALRDMDNTRDVVFMAEVHDETTYVRHHKQKLVLVLSAMRHFAESLHAGGMRMDYVQLDDKDNSGSFTGELGRALSRHHVDRIIVTQPGEWRGVWANDADMGRFNIAEECRRLPNRTDDRYTKNVRSDALPWTGTHQKNFWKT